MALKIDVAVYCHIGHRANNEDNFYANGVYMTREHMNEGGRIHVTNSEDTQLYAVCDGMGGGEFGEEASLRTVEMLKRFQEQCTHPDNTEYLNRLVSGMSNEIDRFTISKGMKSGDSGSTLAMLVLKDWYYRTVNVGDSRVYLLRNGELHRLTKDDSLVQQMVERGDLTPDEAWRHPRKNVITKHLGMPNDGMPLYPTIGKREDIQKGDRFLICSDGLSDALHDTMIRKICVGESTAEAAAEQLARTALADTENAGIPSDNITVIVLDILNVNWEGVDARRARLWSAVRAVSGALCALSAGGLVWSAIQLFRLLR